MNTPESLATSLHWSRQLQKAGWPQDNALFVWWWMGILPDEKYSRNDRGFELRDSQFMPAKLEQRERFAAPTAEEMAQRIADAMGWSPHDVTVELARWMRKEKAGKSWTDPKSNATLTNCWAAFYCYLAENGLLPSKDGK